MTNPENGNLFAGLKTGKKKSCLRYFWIENHRQWSSTSQIKGKNMWSTKKKILLL